MSLFLRFFKQKLHSLDLPCHTNEMISDQAKIQAIQEDDSHRSHKLVDLIHFSNTELNDLIKNFSPFDADELDEKLAVFFHNKQAECLSKYLTDLEEQRQKQEIENQLANESATASKVTVSKTPTSPKQKPKSGKNSTDVWSAAYQNDLLSVYFNINFFASHLEAFMSKALCEAAVQLNRKQLFTYISETFVNNNNQSGRSDKGSKLTMPVPMVSVLQNGKGFGGKQYLVKEFILMPKPNISIQEVRFKKKSEIIAFLLLNFN